MMKQSKISCLLFIAGIAMGTAGNGLLAQSAMEVNRDMLLWKKGFAYYTAVTADIALTDTTIKVNLTDRSASGYQPRSFFYKGTMAYQTALQKDSMVNGSARRYYQKCVVEKSETNPLTLKVESGFWEVWAQRFGAALPQEWRPHVEVVERNAEVFGGSYIVVRQKPGSPDLLGGGALELAFQSMGELSQKWFVLEWPRIRSIQKAKVNVAAAEVRNGEVAPTGGAVSNIVKNVIGRESKLLYEALLGFDGNRQEGDVWVVDGETLDAMVHPTVQGFFRGSALVKAELVKNESPVRTVGEMNGFKLKFVQRGIVDGRSQSTDLCFVVKTVDGGVHETQLTPDDGVFSGEIWLDTDNQSVRYGQMKVAGARYDGFLPKIGDLSAKISLSAKFHFDLTYAQSITAEE